ncbi:hypothetical protein [Synechococcus sp. WH 8020]|uniref:hypothetical protein n=1 Tax=Synechococcus sp. (strain WH8020) TaxID=32052 RepID=UPI000AFAF80E|nr:hypothetical protein [Synechococcus sp. WH 8020]
MKERLGEHPEDFYFDEASRMFIRRGDELSAITIGKKKSTKKLRYEVELEEI